MKLCIQANHKQTYIVYNNFMLITNTATKLHLTNLTYSESVLMEIIHNLQLLQASSHRKKYLKEKYKS
jgi:hypothetical protein